MTTISPRTTGNWVALLRPHLRLSEQTTVRWRVWLARLVFRSLTIQLQVQR